MTQQRDDIVGRLRAGHLHSEPHNSEVWRTNDLLEEAAAEITRQRATVARVQGAAKTIMIGEADELRRLRERHREWHLEIQSLDSERDANAILTEENERLRAENAEAEQRGARAERERIVTWLRTLDRSTDNYAAHFALRIERLDPTKLEGLEHG